MTPARWRLLIATFVTALALSLISTATAHATVDWRDGFLSNPAGSRWTRSSLPGSEVVAEVAWRNGTVSYRGWLEDPVSDGECAVAMIRYEVLINGQWVRHYRTVLEVCRGGATRHFEPRISTYRTRYFAIAACTLTNNKVNRCGEWA